MSMAGVMNDMASYIRREAKKNGWHKYFLTERPVSIGTQPNSGFMDYINYDRRTEVSGKMVWAEIYYNRKLTDKEMQDYEIIGPQEIRSGKNAKQKEE